MTQIAKIVEKIKNKKYEFSRHAVDQSIIRDINVFEMEQAILENAVIIEDYPDDKYGPSCLILGYTKKLTTTSYTMWIFRPFFNENHNFISTRPRILG